MGESTRDYHVGYKKPPTATRFKKGQSGNPKGRPRQQAPDFLALLHRILGQSIVVREGDRTRRVSRAEAIALGLVNDALKQKPGATKLLLQFLSKASSATTTGAVISGVLAAPPEVDMDTWLAQFGDRPSEDDK